MSNMQITTQLNRPSICQPSIEWLFSYFKQNTKAVYFIVIYSIESKMLLQIAEIEQVGDQVDNCLIVDFLGSSADAFD